ncbi:MAG TPA: ATP-binding protein [Planctomycetota bacterium]|nr:ATP-binding protein [Planctomycetota bacterium]HUW32342.1 ATP-binding protein [Planctomycetota bacterium]
MEVQTDLAKWTARMVIELPSTERDQTDAERRFTAFIGRLQVDPATQFSLQVAFHEALANAVEHGNKADPSKCVVAECLANDRMMRISVVDEGEGFNPQVTIDTASDPFHDRGRGLFLIRSLMDEVTYNDRGNAISMVKFGLHAAPQQHDGKNYSQTL